MCPPVEHQLAALVVMNVMPSGRKALWVRVLCLVSTRIPLRLARAAALVGLTLGVAGNARAQTASLLFEGFEGNFPSDNGWSVGDANATSGTAYWDDVNTFYGSVLAHTGSWKGYCAALTNGVFNSSALYPINMQAFMSKALVRHPVHRNLL